MNKKPIEYLVPYFIATLIGAVAGLYLANFIFVQWQNLPQDVLGFTTVFQYKEAYGNIPSVAKAVNISLLSALAPIVLMNVILTIALFRPEKREQYGSAKFAELIHIRKAGLLPTPQEQKKLREKTPSNPSLLIGEYKGKKLEFFGNEFTFVGAPTRSGKGVGIVIPNLLHYTDSVVVLDIKNENWEITAGYRSKYQECYLFCPKADDGRSHRYNPLDYINPDHTKRMGDIQNIANIMYPADDPKDAFWANNAQVIFTGLVLYMMETPERPCSLAELVRLSAPAVPLNEWIESIIEKRTKEPITIYVDEHGKEQPYREDLKGLTKKQEIRPLSAECVSNLQAFAGNASENTRSSILSTMQAPLAIFRDPTVACATSYSDFRLDDVRKRRMSIFVGIQPNELPRFDKLLNLFFSQLISLNTAVLPEQDPSLKYQCLVLLDEFTALGKVAIINKSVAYIAGYNMRLMLIFQNKSQCEEYYGKEGTQTMLSNMACQIIYAPRTGDDAKSYSELLGTQTIKSKSVSKNRGGGGGSTSTSDQSRALMLPQELMEMEQTKEIIKYNANKPIQCNKIRYYEDPILKNRARIPIPERVQPKRLDIENMLRVMRNLPIKEVDTEEQAKAISPDEMVNTEHGRTNLHKIATAFEMDIHDVNEAIETHPAIREEQKVKARNQFTAYLEKMGIAMQKFENENNSETQTSTND